MPTRQCSPDELAWAEPGRCAVTSSASSYSFLPRRNFRLSYKTVFQLLIGLLLLWALGELRLYGEGKVSQGMVLPHAAGYFKALMQMDSAPAVTVAEEEPHAKEAGKLAKLASKYDVT